MLKVFTCLVVALALLALLHPSFARKGRGKGRSLKRWKIKTVCSNKTEDLGQVLSIVSAVDLTVRYDSWQNRLARVGSEASERR